MWVVASHIGQLGIPVHHSPVGSLSRRCGAVRCRSSDSRCVSSPSSSSRDRSRRRSSNPTSTDNPAVRCIGLAWAVFTRGPSRERPIHPDRLHRRRGQPRLEAPGSDRVCSTTSSHLSGLSSIHLKYERLRWSRATPTTQGLSPGESSGSKTYQCRRSASYMSVSGGSRQSRQSTYRSPAAPVAFMTRMT